MIGEQILHYRVLEELGRGGMGVVYEAEDTKLKRLVAIKFLPRQIAASDDERERFKIEAQAAAALNHPNIATIHAIEELDDEIFIVMEYIEGAELKQLTIDSRQLSIADVLDYSIQIASGLQAAHAKGVTHRDIKSSNIMVTESGQVKIMDFGLAKLAGQKGVTKSRMTVGTVAYMSPEQARGEPVDYRTDIWSLGVVLYEMLTGQLPFAGEYELAVINAIVNQEPKPVQEWAFTSWFARDVDIKLDTLGAGPANMVHVPGGTYRLWSANPVELPEYWIDKYEVTNQEYKAFADAGGYQNQAYWKHPFVMQDRTFSWEEAMAMFRDKTNQPGPSTWELGSFPEGRADYPVGGISWYEAAAYAEFAGKSLPTVYDWFKAANGRDGEVYGDIVVLSNFKGQGPARVGQYQGLGGVGTYDMAGNVMEWCWNQAGNQRYILGGSWLEPEYMFNGLHTQTPFDRSETKGFRCVKYIAEPSQAATAAIEPVSFSRDFTKEKPVGDEIFQIYKSYFLYDSTALNAVVESVDESMAHWRQETVTFDAAYGNERVIAHLFLPKNAVAPYQTVIYFPGSEPFLLRSSENLGDMTLIDFIPRTGRALVYPVYKGSYERHLSKPISGARSFRDLTTQWVQDLGRTIDYLQTREDIDTNRLAYMGMSMGAGLGPIFSALEQRLKASVLIWGGFSSRKPPDEVDPLNFAPNARIPVLMINGRYDSIFPFEASQRPLFRLLGAPEKDKLHAIVDGGHVTPMNEVIKETLNWLDRYLGQVQRQVQSSKK